MSMGRTDVCYKNVLATYTHIHVLGTPGWADGTCSKTRWNTETYVEVSNFKNKSFIYSVFYRFIALKFETLWDCRSYRIFCVEAPLQ